MRNKKNSHARKPYFRLVLPNPLEDFWIYIKNDTVEKIVNIGNDFTDPNIIPEWILMIKVKFGFGFDLSVTGFSQTPIKLQNNN